VKVRLPLGLACVAAATQRAGHDVMLMDLMFEGVAKLAIRRTFEEFQPDVIDLSVRNIDDQNMQDGNRTAPPVCRNQRSPEGAQRKNYKLMS
jgi:hypothetical protein